MSQPVDLAAWATDTNIATGTEAGTPTKVDPGAAYEAQGLVPGATFVGPYVNWAMNNFYQWLLYLKNIDTDAYFLGRPFTWTATHTFASGATFNTSAALNGGGTVAGANLVLSNTGTRDVTYSAPRSRTKMLNLQGNVTALDGAQKSYIGNGFLNIECGFALAWEIALDLPSGCVITGLSVRVDEGGFTAQHSSIQLWRKSSGNAPIQIGATGAHSGGAGYQTINIGAVSQTVDTTTHKYWITFLVSDTPGNYDIFTDLLVTFNDPGSLAAS